MQLSNRRIFSWLAVVAFFAGWAFVFWASITVAAPPSRATIVRRQREVQRRIEEAKRKQQHTQRQWEADRRRRQSDWARDRAELSAQHKAMKRRTDAVTREVREDWGRPPGDDREFSLDDLEYRIEPGARFAYYFVLKRQHGEQTSYLGGVAGFEGARDNRGACVLVRDNLRATYSSKSLPRTFPARHTMLPEKLRPGGRGIEPWIDDHLPHQLGRAADWFFPPLPRWASAGATRHKGNSADRMLGRDPAYFEWRVTAVGRTGAIVKLEDSRSFKTNDDRIELKTTGEIQFDTTLGVVSRREAKGTYRDNQLVTPISLKIVLLDKDNLQKLLTSQ